jgi:hypothetical protein
VPKTIHHHGIDLTGKQGMMPTTTLKSLSLLSRQTDYAPLRAGEIVTRGTITAARSVRMGETWQSGPRRIALPGLTVAFSA